MMLRCAHVLLLLLAQALGQTRMNHSSTASPLEKHNREQSKDTQTEKGRHLSQHDSKQTNGIGSSSFSESLESAPPAEKRARSVNTESGVTSSVSSSSQQKTTSLTKTQENQLPEERNDQNTMPVPNVPTAGKAEAQPSRFARSSSRTAGTLQAWSAYTDDDGSDQNPFGIIATSDEKSSLISLLKDSFVGNNPNLPLRASLDDAPFSGWQPKLNLLDWFGGTEAGSSTKRDREEDERGEEEEEEEEAEDAIRLAGGGEGSRLLDNSVPDAGVGVDRRSAWRCTFPDVLMGEDELPWSCRQHFVWRYLGEHVYPSRLYEAACDTRSCWYGHFNCTAISYTLHVLQACRGCQDQRVPSLLRSRWQWMDLNVTVGCQCVR